MAIHGETQPLNGQVELSKSRVDGLDKKHVDLGINSMNGRLDPKPAKMEDASEALGRKEKFEKLLLNMLELHKENIDPDDNFFQLGGDSLTAMKLVAEARSQGLYLTVAEVFANPQLATMVQAVTLHAAQVLESEENDEMTRPFALLSDGDAYERLCEAVKGQSNLNLDRIQDIYPCTPMQEGLMAMTVRDPKAYVAQLVCMLPESVDIEAFISAWGVISLMNPILRTRIVQTQTDGSFQVVTNEKLTWMRASNLSDYLASDKSRLMELGSPLNRFAIVENREDSHRHFVWTAHHATYDGWSHRLLWEQFERILRDEEVVESPPFNHFVKYLVEQDHTLSEQFWKQQLTGVNAKVFPSKPSTDYNPVADTEREHRFRSRKSNDAYTTSTKLRLSWAMIIGQYTESDDVVFGVTVTGRSAPVAGVDNMTGPTISTIPFRVRLSPNISKRDHLQTVQDQFAAIVPFEQFGLQRIRRLGSDIATASSFQNMLVVQPADPPESDTLRGSEVVITKRSAFNSYSLLIECILMEDEEICFVASFDKSVILDKEVQRLLAQFEHVFCQMDHDVEQPLKEIDLLSPLDLLELRAWNQVLPESKDSCLHELVREQATTNPTSQAIYAWDGVLTYAELDCLSSQLANHLLSLGISIETPVPLCFEKSKWVVVAMIAVLKAGGACVLLDSKHPVNRLQAVVQKIQAKVVLVSHSNAELLGAVVTVVIPISSSSFTNTLTGKSPNHGQAAKPYNAAFVIYTSGSTGMPKGVLLEHAALCTSMISHGGSLQVSKRSRVLQFSSYAFDASIYEVMTTLTHGGCVCIPSEHDKMNNIAQFIRRSNANMAVFTPSSIRVLNPNEVPSLDTILMGGEVLTKQVVNDWASSVKLVNGYGPAECTICSLEPVLGGRPVSSIGRASGAVFWIADIANENRLAPVGAIGELLIEGPVLARGYLGDPEKTSLAFIEDMPWLHTFRGGVPTRIYKTGDVVKYNVDGTINFVGRKDNQVKLRGQRIELEEVEHHVHQCLGDFNDQVADVAAEVVILNGNGNAPTLVAFIDLGGERNSSESETLMAPDHRFKTMAKYLRSQLPQSLPPYMVPSIFIPLRRVPMTTSGKQDRKLLRTLASSLSREEITRFIADEPEKQAPITPAERKLQTLWASILTIDAKDISREDNFFHLGGDSILAMKLVGTARAAKLPLTVGHIFTHPRLRNMSSLMECNNVDRATEVNARPFSAIKAQNVESFLQNVIQPKLDFSCALISDVLPTTDFQEWILEENLRTPPLMLAYFFVEINIRIHPSRMESACAALVQHHDVLRTVFVEHEDRHLQVILRELDLPVSHYEVNGDLEEFATALCLQDQDKGLRLGAPFARFMLVRVHEHRYRLIIRLSHTQYDGFCIPQLVDDLVSAYHDEPILSMGNFSLRIYEHIQRIPVAHEYWRGLLHGSNMTQVTPHLKPVDTASSVLIEASGRVDLHALPQEFTAATLATAAWAAFLSRLTNQADVVFGRVVAGRSLENLSLEKMVGPCPNIAPMRVHFLPEWSKNDLLTAVQDQHVSSGPFESTGISEITDYCTDWPKGTKFDCFIRILSDQLTNNTSRFGGEIGSLKPKGPTNSKFSITAFIQSPELRFHLFSYSHVIDQKMADGLVKKLSDIAAHLLISSDIFAASS